MLRQRCRIQKIEGPNEVIDKDTFERQHLKKPSGNRRPSDAVRAEGHKISRQSVARVPSQASDVITKGSGPR